MNAIFKKLLLKAYVVFNEAHLKQYSIPRLRYHDLEFGISFYFLKQGGVEKAREITRLLLIEGFNDEENPPFLATKETLSETLRIRKRILKKIIKKYKE